MSELPYRIPETSPERPPSQEKHVSLLGRLILIFGFILLVAVSATFTPQLAKQIAYSWNIGAERAKADVAKQFLEENPLSGQRIALVAKAVAPSVVEVHVISSPLPEGLDTRRSDPLTLETDLGSGIIIDAQKGHVLTNYHVIENAHIIKVLLKDGREIDAVVVGADRMVDFAVLQIDAEDLEAISWGDSRQVTVGDQVVAIGSPYGFQQTVTSGIISATERYITLPVPRGARRGARPFPHEFLQTDAAINRGNSGGALVDMNGKLIGICTSVLAAESGGNSGIGFAIPSFKAKKIYEEIILHGTVKHGWIGAELDEVTLFEARQMNQKMPMGATIRMFSRSGGSPARDAGLQRGDVILRWGETNINNPLQLIHIITLTTPGTTETVEVFRQGEVLRFDVTVGTRPMDL